MPRDRDIFDSIKSTLIESTELVRGRDCTMETAAEIFIEIDKLKEMLLLACSIDKAIRKKKKKVA